MGNLQVVSAMFILILACGQAAARGEDDPWADFRFIMGEWIGEGDGQPGRGSGGFSLTPDLQEKVLVRRNRAEYPAASGRPVITHDDLMIIFREGGGKRVQASYFDSEGHVVHYAVSASADKESLIFLGDADPSAPRFRLTYGKANMGRVSIKFEIAQPGKPDDFKTYLEGIVRRKVTGRPR